MDLKPIIPWLESGSSKPHIVPRLWTRFLSTLWRYGLRFLFPPLLFWVVYVITYNLTH